MNTISTCTKHGVSIVHDEHGDDSCPMCWEENNRSKHNCAKHGLVEFLEPNQNGDSFCTICWNEAITKGLGVATSTDKPSPYATSSISLSAASQGYHPPYLEAYTRHRNISMCPGCESLDGEHDFGPSCTLEEKS